MNTTKRECGYCKKQGHIISTCPKLARINSTEKCHFCHENGHSVCTCSTLIERDEEAKERCERNTRVAREFAEQMKRQQKEIDERAALRAARLAESIKEYEESKRARERAVEEEKQRRAAHELQMKAEIEKYDAMPPKDQIEFSLRKKKGEEAVKDYTFLNVEFEEFWEFSGSPDGPCRVNKRYNRFQHNVTEEIIKISCDIWELFREDREKYTYYTYTYQPNV